MYAFLLRLHTNLHRSLSHSHCFLRFRRMQRICLQVNVFVLASKFMVAQPTRVLKDYRSRPRPNLNPYLLNKLFLLHPSRFIVYSDFSYCTGRFPWCPNEGRAGRRVGTEEGFCTSLAENICSAPIIRPFGNSIA
jgi:hypothetical protein